jgi:hypothetical protein
MATAATSATLASFAGLRGLAAVSGWPTGLAWLLPITIDAHAMTSARVWLAASTRSDTARRFARTNAIGALTVSIAGNATYHAVGTGLLTVNWPIVVLVGAVPATVLGLTAHLHALRTRSDKHPTQSRTQNRSDGRTKNESRTDPGLLAAAQEADTRHRAEYGRPITRDALRAALRISGKRATELRRELSLAAAKPNRKED